MRIALVAYDFPPLNSGGSQRPYYLANFLRSQNFDVTVFTLNEGNYPSESLNYEIDNNFIKGCKIIRTDIKTSITHGVSESYYFNIVDQLGARWQNELENSIKKEHLESAFNYLLFTCPPFSLASLGVHISKMTNVPLILDMRDAWSQWVAAPYATYFHYRSILKLEHKVLLHAKFVTYVSEQQKNDLLKIHKDIAPTKFIFMPNGFDQYKDSPILKHDQIKIFYSGSFYYNPESERLIKTPWYKKKPYQYLQYIPRVEEWKYRSPYFFFNILKRLMDMEPEIVSKIIVRFAGKKPKWFDDMVADSGLNDKVVHLGFLNKNQMDEEMRNSDYFLVTSAKVKNGRDICVAGKTYEYFSYKKPIIGVVCEGEQKDLLIKSRIAIILDPDDTMLSAKKLKDFLLSKKMNANWNYIDQYKTPTNYNNLLIALKSTVQDSDQ